MAYVATQGTFQYLAEPSYATTYASTGTKALYPESINSSWTHPNPYVEQVGNHLIHKDLMPKNLRFNDQKRDKEALDNLRNRAIRARYGDASPAISGPQVRPPPQSTPVAYSSTLTPGGVAATYTSRLAPTYDVATTLYPDATISPTTPLLAIPTTGKPYSPLATPFHHSGLPYSGALLNPAYPQYHGLSNATVSYNLDRTYTPLGYSANTATFANPAYANRTVYTAGATLTIPQNSGTVTAPIPAPVNPATVTIGSLPIPTTSEATYAIPGALTTTAAPASSVLTYSAPGAYGASSTYPTPSVLPTSAVYSGPAPAFPSFQPAFPAYASGSLYTSGPTTFQESAVNFRALVPGPTPSTEVAFPLTAKAAEATSDASPPASTAPAAQIAALPMTL